MSKWIYFLKKIIDCTSARTTATDGEEFKENKENKKIKKNYTNNEFLENLEEKEDEQYSSEHFTEKKLNFLETKIDIDAWNKELAKVENQLNLINENINANQIAFDWKDKIFGGAFQGLTNY